MLLPAITARFWAEDVSGLILVAIVAAFAASLTGLLLSYYTNVPTGPAIILVSGVGYILSMLVGRERRAHLAARPAQAPRSLIS